MALEVLSGVTVIGDAQVVDMDKLRFENPDRFPGGRMDYEWFEKEIRPHFPIMIRPDTNSITFTLQKGPIKEFGVNGCQVTALIEAAAAIIGRFNEKFPCEENIRTIKALNMALYHQEQRTKSRELRGVEGKSEL